MRREKEIGGQGREGERGGGLVKKETDDLRDDGETVASMKDTKEVEVL